MKLTNPVGRNVSLNADNDINPRACMCRNGFALSSAFVRGKVILQSQGKEFFTWHGKDFFT